MQGFLNWIDGIPTPLLVVLALWMLAAPLQPEPHLVEKWKMLRRGELTRPLDIFDVFFHLAPLALLGVKLARMKSGN